MTLAEQIQTAASACINLLLYGPPGRGKSMAAAAAAASYISRRAGAMVRQLTLPEDTPVAILAGSYRPDPSGGWTWHDGPVTAVARYGGALILDELANASPEAQTFLQGMIDRTPSITLPSGEVITKAPMWVIATQNDKPDILRPAVLDRLPIRIEVLKPDTYDFLGTFAQAAERDLEANTNASLRPWTALHQGVTAGVPVEALTPLLWPGRGKEMADALKLSGCAR